MAIGSLAAVAVAIPIGRSIVRRQSQVAKNSSINVAGNVKGNVTINSKSENARFKSGS